MAPKTATGSFEKGGALFFSLTYFFLNALAELRRTIHARSISIKQHELGLIHPVAFVTSQTVSGILVAAFQSLVFSCCYYFMFGLSKTASDFCHSKPVRFTLLCRVQPAPHACRLGPIPKHCVFHGGNGHSHLPHLCGIQFPGSNHASMGIMDRRISPSPRALEANEFANIDLTCTADQMVPNSPGYNDIRHQA